MKIHKNISWLFAVTFAISMLFVLGSCSQQGERQKAENNDNKNKAWTEFTQNMNNIGDAISDAVNSDDTFAEKANDALDDFETRLENFENKMENSDGSMSESTKQALDKLEQKSENIKNKLSELANETGEKADESKAEIKSSLKELGSSIKAFISKEHQD
jgi:cytochrome c556